MEIRMQNNSTEHYVNFWIGQTPRHDIASEVCKFSLEDFEIDVHKIPIFFEAKTTNPFSRTRFLTPLIDCAYSESDWVFFADDDYIFLENPMNLLETLDLTKTVYVCKHDRYTSKVSIKMDDQKQNNYSRKNWSSLILFNKSKFELTLEDIFKMNLKDLHQFTWCADSEIGEIPLEWNWLVGEYEEIDHPKGLHYTLGGPWYNKPYPSRYNEVWIEYKKRYDNCF